MRESSSRHTFKVSLSRNTQTELLLPFCDSVDFLRLAEYVSSGSLAEEVLSDAGADEHVVGSRKRKKGKGKAVASTYSRPVKRVKLEGSSGRGAKLDNFGVPIICHTFEIDFDVTKQATPEIQSISPMRDFFHIVTSKCDEQPEDQDEVIIDVGTLYPHAHFGKVLLCIDDPFVNKRMSALPLSSLVTLPQLRDDVQDADHDFVTQALQDILASAYKLQQNKRARLSGPLSIIAPRRCVLDKRCRSLPVKLRIEITVSVLETGIFEPLPSFRKKDLELEEAQRRVLTYAFGVGKDAPDGYNGMTDMSFFLSCLHPATAISTDEADRAAQPRELLPKLLPFQRRSVNWLLTREGKQITSTGRIEDFDPANSQLPLFWEIVVPAEGKIWYFNRITGRLLCEEPPADDFRGGILAEEPGLGKTLESIALVMLNPGIHRNPSVSRWDPVGVIDVKEVKTTLIVTPAALAQQWVDELKLHAPSLKVLVYEGWTKVPVPITVREAQDRLLRAYRSKRQEKAMVKLDEDDIIDDGDMADLELSNEEKKELARVAKEMTWCDFVHQYDICITTYNTLQQDLGVARAPLVRPRREVAKYVEVYRDRSPLVMVEWTRVIMDEVQMVGGGKTEEMVSLIPRLSSFAVSGTPARSSVNDLIHVINFLRIDSVTEFSKVWARLQKPGFASYFKNLFNRVGIRTLKAKIQDELTIPQQRRFIVPIQLGKVEKHVYDENFEQALRELGFDARGVAASSGWQTDVTLLRSWLRRLRGICTHPQVGRLSKQQNDRLAKVGTTLKKISEVLEDMKDQNWRKLMDEKKSKIQALVRRAELCPHANNPDRYKVMLEILLSAQRETDDLCAEIQDVITEHEAKGEKLKQELKSTDPEISEEAGVNKGKEVQREGSAAPSEDSVDDALLKTPAGIEYRHKKNALQARLREVLIVLHQIHFRLGDVYNTLGEAYDANEKEAYAAADDLRKRLLKTTTQVAERSIEQIKLVAQKKTLNVEETKVEYCGKGGEKSEDLLREADAIIDILNEQTELLLLWRARIVKLLTESLSASEGEQADGEEYARTLETQGEAEAFLQAYSALLADRRELLVAERTALAAHDVRERKIRHTVAAQRAQRAAEIAKNGGGGRSLDQDEMGPEHEVLEEELSDRRKGIKQSHSGRAIKSIVVDLQGVAGSITNENDPEKIIAKEWINRLKALIKGQTTLHDKLEADMTPFRKAFNDRVQYFRQLQELSDSVTSVHWEGSVNDAIQKTHEEEEAIRRNITKHQARQRYLKNLVDNEDENNEDKICILCRCEFIRGFMTQCAHVYCEGCLKAWFTREGGKNCPVCRVVIDAEQLQRISLEEKEGQKMPPVPRRRNNEEAPKSRRVIEYNEIDPGVMEELKKIDCLGSYGTKIETLVRHLLYLDDVDPGCKSIVFSAWADSLYIIERALTENGIVCLRIDQKKGKQNAAKVFKTDHRIRVLLLHGERENAGLNVTCASRVFLTESVVQHSFELQAIARIDRLGQTRPTEVYCYYAENTVERNILDLAAKRGLSLYTKDKAVGTVQVTSFEMDQNRQIDSPVKTSKKQAGQKGDFIFKADDMLAILFPHLFEDVEYLLPEDANADVGVDVLDGDFEDGIDGEMNVHESRQPIAGPSRLGH